jgi:N-acetylglucosaminyldiphosphoundecaprenol N-acetyl-beta-D-mannosaminyltransferase
MNRRFETVIGTPIDVIGWNAAIERISKWSKARESRVVCICNAHSLVTACRDESFSEVLRKADMTTPDGYPIAKVLRWMGHGKQERINGPDLMLRYCEQAAETGESIFLYGGQPDALHALEQSLLRQYPRLRIAGAISPPFRQMSLSEEAETINRINESGAGVVWVGLGCPKQEAWMVSQKGRIHAVMVGVGAAFDYHAGTLKRAPLWMQRNGLEWCFRLMQEPGRLWRRYLVTNSLFIYFAFGQFFTASRMDSTQRRHVGKALTWMKAFLK